MWGSAQSPKKAKAAKAKAKKPGAVSRKGAVRAGNFRPCGGCTNGLVNGMRHGPCKGSGLIRV